MSAPDLLRGHPGRLAYHLGRLARHESVIGQSVVTPRHGETTKQANGDYKAMNRNQLFLNSLEELERLTRIPQSHVTEYETLRISALLRLLILDAEPLFEQVNRSHRLKIRFRSSYPASLTDEDLPEPPFENADTPFPVGTKTLTKKDFIARFAAFIAPYEYTVKDLILYGANLAGGVHAGRPSSDTESVIYDTAEKIRIFDKDPSLLELRGIGQVVVRSLAPLYQAVRMAPA